MATITQLKGYELNFTGVFGNFTYNMAVVGYPVIAKVYAIVDENTGQEISTYYEKLKHYYVSRKKIQSILITGKYWSKDITFDKEELTKWIKEN